MTTQNDDEQYLIRKANEFGLEGYRVLHVIKPESSTQSIYNAIFVLVKESDVKSSTSN